MVDKREEQFSLFIIYLIIWRIIKMAKNKFYQVTREIEGVKYTAQFNGVGGALDCVDTSYIDNSSNTSARKFGEHILKHVIVEPAGLTVDDFDDVETYSKVIKFGSDVMNGRFREEANKTTTKE